MKCTLKRKWFRLLLVILLFMYVEVASGQASYNRENDQHGWTVFMENGGWCWFQDPRGIIADRKLIMGAVKGHGNGEALVGVYDLKKKKSLGFVIVPRRIYSGTIIFNRKTNRTLNFCELNFNFTVLPEYLIAFSRRLSTIRCKASGSAYTIF